MTIKYVLMCDYHLQAIEGGKHSVVGIFEAIWAQAFPATHERLNVVVSLSPEVTDRGQRREIKLRLIDEDGKQMLELPITVELNAQTPVDAMPDLTVPFRLAGIVFERPGSYRFEVFVEGTAIGESRFTVQQVPPSAPTP